MISNLTYGLSFSHRNSLFVRLSTNWPSKNKATTRCLASSFFVSQQDPSGLLDQAIRRAVNRMADHRQNHTEEEEDIQDFTRQTRIAALNLVMEKLDQSNTVQLQQALDQQQQQQNQPEQQQEYDDNAMASTMSTESSSADTDLEPGVVYDHPTLEDESMRRITNKNNKATIDLLQDALGRVMASMGPPSSYDHDTQPTLRYGLNPTITATALAHSLWSYVIRPGVDTIIDATAGNGHDATRLAQLLLLSGPQQPPPHSENNNVTGKLICIDIQERACSATRQALMDILTPIQMQRHVEVIHGSHAQLSFVGRDENVGLVVYNLGFLPGSDKAVETQVESTIVSLSQAAAMIRIGGMISIMTYPRSNPHEDWAVAAFLVQLSAKTKRFRVNEHKQLARPHSPILYTATRIK